MVDNPQQQPALRNSHAESPWWPAMLLAGVVILIIAGIVMNPATKDTAQQAAHFAKWKTVLGVVATLGIFTILYKENPLFRFMEHVFIGLATGVGIVILWVQIIYPDWYLAMIPKSIVAEGKGEWWLVFQVLIGLLFYTVYFPKLSWMNRFALGVVIGWVSGFAFREFFGVLAPQIVKSFNKTPVTTYSPDNAVAGPNNLHFLGLWWHPWAIIFIVVLVCVFAYFLFSVEHRARWIRQPAVTGRYFLMITLGAIFGTTVMGRFSLAIERLDFLLRSFTGWLSVLFK